MRLVRIIGFNLPGLSAFAPIQVEGERPYFVSK